jgi:hypothetical protein
MKGLLLVLALSVALSTSAFATAELKLTSGATTVTILDNGAGDTNPAVGQISFNGAVGSWGINTPSGITFGPTGPIMDVGSLDATASGTAAPLTITFTDTGFSTPSPGFMLASSGHIVTGTGTAAIKGWVDNTNNPVWRAGRGADWFARAIQRGLRFVRDRRPFWGAELFADRGRHADRWKLRGYVEYGFKYCTGPGAGGRGIVRQCFAAVRVEIAAPESLLSAAFRRPTPTVKRSIDR